MTKIELANAILEINEEKKVVVKSQRFEDAAKLRDKEKRLIVEYEEKYGLIPTSSDELKKFIIFLKAELRDVKIDEIFRDEIE